MRKKLLITRPEHDDTTYYLSSWSKKALDVAHSKGIKVLDLNQKRACRNEVEGMLTSQKPELIIFNGHGSENIISGHNNDPLIIAKANEQLLKGTITYAVSCKSARKLGPKSVEKGTRSYIGYIDDFIFFYDPNKFSRPLEDNTAGLFLEPSSKLTVSLIKGNTAGESCIRSKQSFQKNIRKLLSSEVTKEETSLARYLWWDLKNQVCLGDSNSKF